MVYLHCTTSSANPASHMKPAARSRFRWQIIVTVAANCLLVACPPPPPHGCESEHPGTEQGLSVAVECILKKGNSPIVTQTKTSARLYLDVSASMRGFLDGDYRSDSHNFLRVIDTLVLRLGVDSALGFGSTLRPINSSLGNLGRPELYTDNKTDFEAALTKISRDSLLTATHVVLGDGRRDTPEQARSQFSALASLASQWTSRQGTFIVAVSLANFHTVAGDPSGCGTGPKSPSGVQRCPLYAFVFASPGDEDRIGALVSAAFEHIYAWPLPRSMSLELEDANPATGSAGSSGSFEQRWISGPPSPSVARLQAPVPTKGFRPLRLVARGDNVAVRQWHNKLLEDARLSAKVSMSVLGDLMKGEKGELAWINIDASAANPRIKVDTSSAKNLSVRAGGNNEESSLMRYQLILSGAPRWLDEFVAASARDPVKTMGLSLLFIAPGQEVTGRPPTAYLRLN